MHLNAFRIPYAPAGWLETNSETNWARKHATMCEPDVLVLISEPMPGDDMQRQNSNPPFRTHSHESFAMITWTMDKPRDHPGSAPPRRRNPAGAAGTHPATDRSKRQVGVGRLSPKWPV
jgi:hypothetical protein